MSCYFIVFSVCIVWVIFLQFSPCKAAIIYPNCSGQPEHQIAAKWCKGCLACAWLSNLCKANYYTKSSPDILRIRSRIWNMINNQAKYKVCRMKI